MVDGKPIQLGLWDTTNGRSGFDYDRLRPLSYPQTNIFLVLFAVCSKDGLERVKSKWIPEISHHCPGVPWILVGTKCDFRDIVGTPQGGNLTKSMFVTKKEAQAMVKELDGCQYIECSAVSMENVKKVFDEAIRYVA